MSVNTIARGSIEAAIDAYRAAQQLPKEERPSLRHIAQDNHVPLSTLSDRVSGGKQARHTSHSHLQALTASEEDCLVNYIRRTSQAGRPPTPKLVYETAEQLRRNRLDLTHLPYVTAQVLGLNWLQKFRSRHPEVDTLWS